MKSLIKRSGWKILGVCLLCFFSAVGVCLWYALTKLQRHSMTFAELVGWHDAAFSSSERNQLDLMFRDITGSAQALNYTVHQVACAYDPRQSYIYSISMARADFAKVRDGIVREKAEDHQTHNFMTGVSPYDNGPEWWVPLPGVDLDFYVRQDFYRACYDPEKEILLLYTCKENPTGS